MNIVFKKIDENKLDGTIVIIVDESLKLAHNTQLLDQNLHGLISKTINNADIFEPKFGNLKLLTAIDVAGELKQILLVAIGKTEELKSFKLEQLGGKIYQALANMNSTISIMIPTTLQNFTVTELAMYIAHGCELASYRFEQYKTKLTAKDLPKLAEIHILLEQDPAPLIEQYVEFSAIKDGLFLARDLITEPPNKLFPDSYAARITTEFATLADDAAVKVEILGEREMRNLGMGALLGVGQGSINESKMVIIKYNGLDEDTAPLAFIGKGVTFDSGGISLKPAAGMEDMKYDMAGSAAVVGLLKTLVLRKAKVNVIGVVGLVENMPGGNAQRPSDVVTSASGQTIEVLNTDAEGRLVLADALWYTQDKYKPKFMIDLATLTGAIVISLGSQYAGLFSNNQDLTTQLVSSGQKTDEKLWALPMSKEYDDMLKSDIADVANISAGREAGSITAAQFLQRFVGNVPWAHLDIAGMAWNKKGSPTTPKGAVGFGVRLLNQMVKDFYESN